MGCDGCKPCMNCDPQCMLDCQTCKLCCDICKPGLCPLECCLNFCPCPYPGFKLCKAMGLEAGCICHCTCACCPSCMPEIGPLKDEHLCVDHITRCAASDSKDDKAKDSAPKQAEPQN